MLDGMSDKMPDEMLNKMLDMECHGGDYLK